MHARRATPARLYADHLFTLNFAGQGIHDMRRIVALSLYALFCFGLSAQASAQPTRTVPVDVLRQLLSLSAAAPHTADAAPDKEQGQHPSKFYDGDNPPPDDAPAEDLLDYWKAHSHTVEDVPKLSDAVRQRLVGMCEEQPEILPDLLALFANNAQAIARVKKIYDGASQRDIGIWSMSLTDVRAWLRLNSSYFLDELLVRARAAQDREGYVENEEAFRALAKIDWPTAEILLRERANGDQPRLAALALALLYQHAREVKAADDEEQYRTRLQTVVAEHDSPARARATAIDVLSLTDWSGRDEWYLSLFADETLLKPTDGDRNFYPLTTLFKEDPDKWIPVMANLVESKNTVVQQTAASCLAQYAGEHPRRDAILPVLRWLSEPDWFDIGKHNRDCFVMSVEKVEVPESVPGLIWIIEHEEDNRGAAASVVAHYKDPRAIPVLKKVLAEETDEDRRSDLIGSLLACGGLSEAEQLAALEAYAGKLATNDGRTEIEHYRDASDSPLSVLVSIGLYLAEDERPPDTLVTAVLARAQSLQRTNPAQAGIWLEIAHGWETRLIDLDMLRRIGAGTADAASIVRALARRVELRKRAGPELQALATAGGTTRSIAAVLLGDKVLAQHILATGNQLAQIALLASARLTQLPLPVAQVGTLLGSKNPTLALAAESYLLAEDSEDAGRLVLARHPHEGFITGWRESVSLTGGTNCEALGKAEASLRAELFKQSAPLETIALLLNDERPRYVVRIYADKVVYTDYENAARYRERTITNKELARFKSALTDSEIMEPNPQFGSCNYRCTPVELLSLTPQSGRRVFSLEILYGWSEILDIFARLSKGDGVKTHYWLADEIKGLEVLHADNKLLVRDVWQQGADIRVYVERVATPTDAEQQEQPDSDTNAPDDQTAPANQSQPEPARAEARFTWRSFAAGRLDAEAQPPAGHATFYERTFQIDTSVFPVWCNRNLVQAIAGDSVVLAGRNQEDGLWKKARGQERVRIGDEGEYEAPLVTPDGKWVVVSQTDVESSQPASIVRLNLQTGRVYRVDLPPADRFMPLAYVAAHGQVLLRRAKNVVGRGSKTIGPNKPEFYLLDAATGRTQLVTGDFTPFRLGSNRALQPTNKPAEFWVAIPDRTNNQTRVGRYSVRDFSFQPLLVVPHIAFDDMWVDESTAQLYVVYEGQLLRLPLRSAP
jgi:hypothetical protein